MMPQDHSETVPVLAKDFYGQVERRLLGTAQDGSEGEQQETGSCVLFQSGVPPTPLTPRHSTSLRRQLHQIVTWPGALHDELDNRPPDAFVFIRPAGIALRHTLDGFYDKLYGGIVRRHGPKRPPLALLPIETFKHQPWNIDAEAELLKSKIGSSIGHLCLIDNNARYYDSSDLQMAAAVAHAAGVKDVSALRTMLFENVDPRQINVNKLLVSDHAKFMRRLGKLCTSLS
jgi:hypothetical protein